MSKIKSNPHKTTLTISLGLIVVFLVIGHNDIEEYFIILECSNNIEYKISYDYLEDEQFSSDLYVIKPDNI